MSQRTCLVSAARPRQPLAMIAQRASYDLAYLNDIPGTRCGPEDGPWPRSYQVLNDSEIWTELTHLARPQTVPLANSRRADCINFQPCPRARTQDRYIVRQLNIHGRLWSLTGVFDGLFPSSPPFLDMDLIFVSLPLPGHLGDATVEHVAHHLPIIIGDVLRQAFEGKPLRPVVPSLISNLLSRSIVAFDDAIAGDVLDLFPGGIAGLSDISDEQIRRTINDQFNWGQNYKKAKLSMYGTTALVALVDPDHENLWVANVGDCQAILVTPNIKDKWKIEMLTTNHNGDNDAEVDRVRREHPDEDECVLDRRVLGALAPFRCLGDVPFKQPPEFSRRILYNLFPGFHDVSPWEEFLARNQSPPYISAEPEITHCRLDPLPSYPKSPKGHPPSRYLILCSDGFTDLCTSSGQQWVIANWAQDVGSADTIVDLDMGKRKASNLALRLLRRALGGEDCFSVSRVLTLDMDVAWIDDTAIVVQTL